MDAPRVDKINVACGVFLIICGLIFVQQSLQVDLGTWRQIGPGGMPMALSLLLIFLGAIVLLSGFSRPSAEAFGPFPWRGAFFILLAPVLFGLTVRPLGLVPGVFLTTLFASFASTKMTAVRALILSVLLTIFSTFVFSYGLELPFARFGPWLRF